MRVLAVFFALLAAPAFAVEPPKQDEPPSGEVVVTAQFDRDAAALRNCLDRKCPPPDDIAATLQLAANQFTAGDYRESRATLLAARNRNNKFAKKHPVEVSQLHSAIAVVSTHLGDGKGAWSGRLDELGALKAGLSKEDPRVLMGRMDLAEGYVFAGRVKEALNEYADVAKDAQTLHLTDIQGAALLRRTQVLVVLSERQPNMRRRANAALAQLLGRSDPGLARYVTAARALQVTLNEPRVSTSQERAIAAWRPAERTLRPQLLYQPEINFGGGDADLVPQNGVNSEISASADTNDLRNLPMQNFNKQWVDIAFSIKPDGRVIDVKVARQSAALSDDWSAKIAASVAARRYAPMKLTSGDRLPRLERYTFTSIMTTHTRSRIPVRGTKPRVLVVDLSHTLTS